MNQLLFVIMMASDPTEDLAKKMKALEIFLQDQEDHKEYCPKLNWEQPKIEVYREKMESQLPEECKKE